MNKKRKAEKSDYSQRINTKFSKKNLDKSFMKIADFFKESNPVNNVNNISEDQKIIKKFVQPKTKQDIETEELIQKKLSINKFMYVPKKSKRETLSEILFPLIIRTPLGELKEHPEKFLYFSESNYLYLTLETTNENLVVYHNEIKIGYIYRDISILLKSFKQFKTSIKCFIVKTGSDFNLIILLGFKRNLYNTENCYFEGECDELRKIFYKITNTYDLPIELIRNVNEILKKTVNKNKFEFIQFISDWRAFIIDTHKEEQIDKSLHNTKNNEIVEESKVEIENKNVNSIREEEENQGLDQIEEKKEEMDQFLLKNINLIVQNALSCDYLMKCDDIIQLREFLKLPGNMQSILIKMYKKKGIWTNKSYYDKSLDDLISHNFINDYRILIDSKGQLDYNLLFTFLYNLNNDDLKFLGSELSKITKLKEIETKMNLISYCFINNPFYNLEFDSDIESLSKLNKFTLNCSKLITSYNFSQITVEKLSKKNGFNTLIGSEEEKKSNPLKYISDHLKSSHLRKMNLTSFHEKFKKAIGIIKQIDYYLHEKSSTVLENFFSYSNKENKIQLVIKLLKTYDYMVTLNKSFERAFDIATNLFFFFSESKDINDLSRQYYGFEIYENYDNYTTNILIKKEIEKTYLIPIFTERFFFTEYDSLIRLKHSIIVTTVLIKNQNEMYSIVSQIFNNFFDYLVNMNLDKQFPETFKDTSLLKENLFLIDKDNFTEKENIVDVNKKLLNHLFTREFDYVLDSFLSKYQSQHIASELLTIFVQICEKRKKFKVSFLIYLILLHNPCNHRKRGFFWYRAILIYHRYLKFNKGNSLDLVKLALKDKYIKTGYLYKIKKYFNDFSLKKGEKKQINKLLLDNYIPSNDFFNELTIKSNSLYDKKTGRRIYYEPKTKSFTTVENIALSYYETERNFKGIHGENLVFTALYNIFMWDIIYYDKINYVFQSPFQSYPLDFFTPDFHKNRQSSIEERLDKLKDYKKEDIKREIRSIFENKSNIVTPFLNWSSNIISEECLLKIALGIGMYILSKIFEEMSKNLKLMIRGKSFSSNRNA